jgi:uncharacterized membrane protein (UPF0127 family)
MEATDPAGELDVLGNTFDYELAAGELARERGLSGRPCMAPGWGLLLEWPNTDERAITMQGMLFDLDLVFLDESNTVVDVIRRAEANSSELYIGGPARRVLEVETGAIP